jgi:pimeloyl-ACP methyl ester carboxylesterase
MSTTHWVEVDGAQLAASFSGNATAGLAPLVFLHAGVADQRMWSAQLDAFGRERAVLAYDRRGFGASRVTRPVPHSRSADLWAAMDGAGLEHAVLVGCSQGGRVALDAALERPERVLGLVLVAPSVSGVAPPAAPGAATQALQAAIAAADAVGDLDAVNEQEAQLWLDGPASPAGRVGGAARALFLAMNGIALRAGDPGPVLEAAPAWDRLEQIEAPTLLLWGDLDLPHLQARSGLLVQRIRGARGQVLPGVAHLPSLEAPQAFNAALREFLVGR